MLRISLRASCSPVTKLASTSFPFASCFSPCSSSTETWPLHHYMGDPLWTTTKTPALRRASIRTQGHLYKSFPSTSSVRRSKSRGRLFPKGGEMIRGDLRSSPHHVLHRQDDTLR